MEMEGYRVGSSRATTEAQERLMRMARVLVASLRIKIMAALSIRPMSPKMLHEEFEEDRYELSTIDENLKELKRYGWVELIDTKTGGARRSATEHFYRATQLPIFDSTTWPALPKTMREMVSWRIFTTLVKRVSEALAAGTLDARGDRHFTWTPGLLDRIGWKRVIARVDGLFEFFLKELQDASLRLADSDEQPIPVMAVLAAFESPAGRFTPVRHRAQGSETSITASSRHALSLRMAKAMVDPLRLMILSELSTRPMSARMFLEEFGGSQITKGEVYRAFSTLRQFDWLVLIDTKTGGRRRGGEERFYRAARPPIFDSTTWLALPESMKDMVSAKIFETLAVRLREAMEAGTLDAREDRHFTWAPGLLDQLGWERVIARVDGLFEFVLEEVKNASLRLEDSDEQPIPVTVALAVFESPAAPLPAD